MKLLVLVVVLFSFLGCEDAFKEPASADPEPKETTEKPKEKFNDANTKPSNEVKF